MAPLGHTSSEARALASLRLVVTFSRSSRVVFTSSRLVPWPLAASRTAQLAAPELAALAALALAAHTLAAALEAAIEAALTVAAYVCNKCYILTSS